MTLGGSRFQKRKKNKVQSPFKVLMLLSIHAYPLENGGRWGHSSHYDQPVVKRMHLMCVTNDAYCCVCSRLSSYLVLWLKAYTFALNKNKGGT